MLRLLLAGALIWAGLAALFRSDPGRGLLVRVINSVAGERVQLAGAYGEWPFRGGFHRVAVADAQGPWLVLSNVSWQVQAREVLGPPYRVRRVAAEAVDWLRLPRSSTTNKTSRPPRLLVETLRVEHFRPATNLVAGVYLDLVVQGGVEHTAAGWLVLLDARAADGTDGVEAVLRTGDRFALALRLNESSGGVVTRRWLPALSGLQADFFAQRAPAGWQGSLRAEAGTQGVVRVGWQRDTNKVWDLCLGAQQVGGEVLGQPWRLDSAVLRWIPAERRGRFQVAARLGGEPVWAESALIRRPEGINLPNLLLTARGVRARVSVQREGEWQGDGRVALQSGGALAHWLGGRADVEGRLRFDWAGRRFHVDGTFPDVQTAAGRWSGVDVSVQSEDGTTMAVEGGWATFTRGAEAWLEQVHVRGSLQAQRPGWRVALDRLVARVGQAELNLQAPMEVTAGPAGLTWTATRIAVGAGEVNTSGTLHSNLQAMISWTNLPLAVLLHEHGAGLDGRLDGRLELLGTRPAPELCGHLLASDVRVRQVNTGIELSPAAARLDIAAGAGRAAVELNWSGWSEQPLRARAEGPLSWSWQPWRLEVPRDQPGHGMVRGALDLARLERVFDLRGARIRGQLAGALDLSGTLDNPVMEGRLSVADGQVDIPETGTALRDIQLVLEGDRERLLVRRGSAGDGAAGRLGLEGSVLFDPVRHFPVQARLSIQRAELWRRGGSRAVVDGALDLKGDLQRLTLSGQLQAPVVQVKLGRRKPSIPRLPVTGLAEAPARSQATRAESGQATRVKLDVGLKVPRTAEISGRGLEANWMADLHLGGRLGAPQLSGSVQAKRGYFLFMGRRFDIESAWVGLDGRQPPQPTMNLLANCRARDMTARLHVSGPVLEPVLELTSDPAYPTDEVLSRLLFGKSADSISAFQAVSLAHGLNVLRGRGSSMDVLDRSQSLLRVDQLELRQDAEQGTVSSVSVGKYIGRRVFVQGETALDGSGDLIAVEVDLAPSLTLQTETSPGIREGIGLKWRRDY